MPFICSFRNKNEARAIATESNLTPFIRRRSGIVINRHNHLLPATLALDKTAQKRACRRSRGHKHWKYVGATERSALRLAIDRRIFLQNTPGPTRVQRGRITQDKAVCPPRCRASLKPSRGESCTTCRWRQPLSSCDLPAARLLRAHAHPPEHTVPSSPPLSLPRIKSSSHHSHRTRSNCGTSLARPRKGGGGRGQTKR
jgi:hypothetical protein